MRFDLPRPKGAGNFQGRCSEIQAMDFLVHPAKIEK
jgi:hypothetical protein